MYGGQFGLQHLDRHLAVVLEVFGEVDRGHAAGTDFVLDGIAVRKGSFQSFDGIRHRSIRCDFRYDHARFRPRITADEVRRLTDPLPPSVSIPPAIE